MGRSGKLAMACVRDAVKKRERNSRLSSEATHSFRLLAERLTNGAPRTIPCFETPSPALVFTDGASENGVHTIGGVLVLPSNKKEFFSGIVPAELSKAWEAELKHRIGPVEMYAVLVARALWPWVGERKPDKLLTPQPNPMEPPDPQLPFTALWRSTAPSCLPLMISPVAWTIVTPNRFSCSR